MIQAAVLEAPGKLSIERFPETPLQRDGAILRPTHCGVCGTDPHMYSGHLAVPMPLVMGHEFSGILEAVGPDFPARDVYGRELRPGDEVAVGTTALERAFGPGLPWAGEGMGLGRSVVVQGLGPIGIMTGAAARAMGASPVIGIDRIPLRLEMARRFGFDEVLSLGELGEVEDRVQAVRSMTHGLGADVVVEVVGLPPAFAESLRLVRKGGRVVEFGHFTDNGTMALNPQDVVNLDVDILGSYAYPNAQIGTSLAFLSRYAEVYPFEDLVTHTFGVGDTERAIQASRDKVCVKAMVVSGS